MILVSALMIAVICGSLGAAICLIAGFGWATALIMYWLMGNLGLFLVLIPRLWLRGAPAEEGNPPEMARGLPAGRAIWALFWLTIGLTVLFWQAIPANVLPADTERAREVGGLLGLHAMASGSGYHYDLRFHLPPALGWLTDRIMHLDVWVIGVLAYLNGVSQLFHVAINRASGRAGV